MEALNTDALVGALAVIGVVIVISALLSGLIDRSGLPQVAVFLALGAALGPAGLGVLHITLESPALRVASVLSLTLVLFTDAVSLNVAEVRRRAGLAFRVLVPGTMLTAALIALAGWWLLGLPVAGAAILGAALASSDPVLLRGLLRRKDIPADARHALQLESGLNDAVLLPVVLVAMVFMSGGMSLNALGGARLGLNLFILGPGAGVGVGLLGVAALDLVRRRIGIRRDYESLYSLGVAFTAYAAAELVHGSGFLAAFAAGITIAALDVELCDCFVEYGGVTAEMMLLFTFVLFGSSLIWTGLTIINGPVLIFAAFALLIRTPVYLLSLVGSGVDTKGRLLIAWFGPRGLSSLLIVLLPVFAGLAGSQQLFSICALVVLVSVVLHGGSPLLLAGLARKRAAREARALEAAGDEVSRDFGPVQIEPRVAPAEREAVVEAAVPTVAAHAPEAEAPIPEGASCELGKGSCSVPGFELGQVGPEMITVNEVKALFKAGEPVVLLDVLTEKSISFGVERQIKGAIRLVPEMGTVPQANQLKLNKDAWIIAYCACPHDETSIRIARELQKAGWPKARALDKGWEAWLKAGLPVEPRK
jgi:NhaP-type Na+/H+ or K+/H+ antiporter/rhodanese-related sulfurtransferase